MLFSREIIQQIKNNLDIVQIIGEYVHSLKKSGKNWLGLCPFHNDKHPSFSVSSEYGIYKCFSCGESGDLISFIEKIEGLDFTEAVLLLAKRAGVKIDLDKGSQIAYGKRNDLIVFNERMIKLFQFFLLKKEAGKSALSYLTARGIDQEIIEKFRIGYVPREYGRLEQILLKKNFKIDFLAESGLFRRENNRLKALFFDRIIFPIINYKSECIGFGGRVLADHIKPKYINSPETIAYKKGANLYGLNTARENLKYNDRIFIVEGYMDVIACYKNGIKNVVAPCGTAITREQIKLLTRFTSHIVLLLDGDAAGIKGVFKALIEAANIENMKLSVLVLPANMDPDDFFNQYDQQHFLQFEKQAVDAFDFLMFYKTKEINIREYSQLIVVLNSIFDYIRLWENRIVQDTLLDRLAHFLEIKNEILNKEFDNYCRKLKKIPIKEKNEADTGRREKNETALEPLLMREIDLILLLQHHSDRNDLIKKCGLYTQHFYHQQSRQLYEYCLKNDFDINSNFIDQIGDNRLKTYMTGRLLSSELEQGETILKNSIIDRISDIIKKYYLRLNKNIIEKIKLGEMYNDHELIKELQEEKTIIINEILKLSKLQELKV